METWSKKKEAAAAAAAIVKATFPFPFFHEEKTMNGAQMCASKLYYKNW